MKAIISLLKDVAIAVVIALLILAVINPIVVKESSMLPNFYDGDYLLLNKQAYTIFGEVERGDVVVFHTELKDEREEDKHLIKRIIGLPGEVVEVKDGYVYINDRLLDEPYLEQQGLSGDMEPVVVPQGHYFVMGDNRPVSLDSRSERVGCIDGEEIMGKVFIRLYPFSGIQLY